MARNKKREENSGGDWMTTYGDMVTLLLCFFVLLYSFSSVDAEKFNLMIEGLQGKLGVLSGGKTISDGQLINKGIDSIDPSVNRFGEVYDSLSNKISEEGLEEDIKLEITEKGLTIHFSGKVLFDLGRAKIKDNSRKILNDISGVIRELPNDIMVEGHTDNLPINSSRYPSNWELSTARATNVVKYFIEKNGLSPQRLSAAGYSKYKPLEQNDSQENRSLNRRVDVVILKMEKKGGYEI